MRAFLFSKPWWRREPRVRRLYGKLVGLHRRQRGAVVCRHNHQSTEQDATTWAVKSSLSGGTDIANECRKKRKATESLEQEEEGLTWLLEPPHENAEPALSEVEGSPARGASSMRPASSYEAGLTHGKPVFSGLIFLNMKQPSFHFTKPSKITSYQ